MECTVCGRYAPPDPETGYDADGTCPDCADEDPVADDEPLDPARVGERDILMAAEALAEAIDRADTIDRALELAQLIGACVYLLETAHMAALYRARTLNT